MGGTERPSARFDDLTRASASFRLDGYLGEVVAHRPGEVAGALAAIEDAARRGEWAAGFVSYEAAPGLDPALAVRAPDPAVERPPLAWFGLYQRRVSVDAPQPAPEPEGGRTTASWSADVDLASYRDRVGRARGHIGAGDTYQLNLTHRWRSRAAGDPWMLYRRLIAAQRPAYGAFVDTGRWAVASASPELFFHWRDGLVTCRPMKGTAPRGRWSEEDEAIGAALASSPKDRAENVMIVDLVRNDLGRLAEFGTVSAMDLFELERYPTVWQLASEVSARPRRGTTLRDVFRALFPCGSVTGAPKHRTMALITELEGDCRGVYCGAIGFVGPGEARFNVAIRTVVVDRSTGEGIYGSGGGIVWDSEAEGEYAETRTKAEILFTSTPPFDLVETMAFEPREGLRNCDRHLERMAGSASYFGYAFCQESLRTLLKEQTASLVEAAIVRLSLSSTGRASIESRALPAASRCRPVRLEIDGESVDSSDVSLFHKTSLRLPYSDRLARHPQADDVVLVNERGQVTETTTANLAVCLDGRWCTPPLDAGCLPGVQRAILVANGTLVVRAISVAELQVAVDVALVSSVRGWRRAVIVRSG
ncbi:MAG: para-aminobenzoate synthetase / 4-amino-4-deoxychorismate lyase [Acidimicrobiaceae bacterium]|jgi:para-aminobenzoate synthetase/4-amino-4-deoxychorismate lyase|nr:para-aminobenzoate synthetase / 4-amino-4-deoxychorismate lyase [Acidimicrobiaceae bacterium]